MALPIMTSSNAEDYLGKPSLEQASCGVEPDLAAGLVSGLLEVLTASEQCFKIAIVVEIGSPG